MNIKQIIDDLIAERLRLDRTIAALEELQRSEPTAKPSQGMPVTRRRGRKWMSPAERLAVSERMRQYWAKRKSEKRTGTAS